MKYLTCLLVIPFFVALPARALRAQQGATGTPLADTQKLGKRVFEQRCSVCHTLPSITSKRYGPALYKDLVAGNEDAIREIIRNGSPGKMPGFKLGLEPSEIDAIVAYLKTLPKPAALAGSGQQTPEN